MEFQREDHDWTDYHRDFSKERARRYEEVLVLIQKGIENIIEEFDGGRRAEVEVPYGLFSVSVKGDARRYQPIVILRFEEQQSHTYLDQLYSMITNRIPVCQVLCSI